MTNEPKMIELETGTDLLIPSGLDLKDLYADGTPAKIEAVLKKIEDRCRSEVFDMDDKKSREACRSLAHKVARSKTTMEGAGKELSDELRAKIAPINTLRNLIEDRLNTLRDDVRAPLDKWEVAEDARIAEINAKIEALRLIVGTVEGASTSICEDTIERVKEIVPDEETFGEFLEIAAPLHADALAAATAAYDAAVTREEEARELEELRAEKAQREEADRLAREADEQKARDEEAERQRIAQEEAAEAERIEREAKIKADAEAAARQRIEDEAARKKAEDERRAADKRHRQKVRRQILDALRKTVGMELDEISALIEAIEEGKIPHVSITF